MLLLFFKFLIKQNTVQITKFFRAGFYNYCNSIVYLRMVFLPFVIGLNNFSVGCFLPSRQSLGGLSALALAAMSSAAFCP